MESHVKQKPALQGQLKCLVGFDKFSTALGSSSFVFFRSLRFVALWLNYSALPVSAIYPIYFQCRSDLVNSKFLEENSYCVLQTKSSQEEMSLFIKDHKFVQKLKANMH